MHKHYVYLLIAVLFELLGTSSLQASQQFTRFWPSILVVVGFIGAFYFMTITLKYMPLGIVYAIWSGLGIVLIAMVGYFVFNQAIDLPAFLGLSFIIVGILIIHLFSNMATY